MMQDYEKSSKIFSKRDAGLIARKVGTVKGLTIMRGEFLGYIIFYIIGTNCR